MTSARPLRPADPAEVADALAYALLYDGKRRVHHAGDAISGRLGKIGDSISLSHRDDHKPLSPGTPPLPLRFPVSFSTRRKGIVVAISVPGEFEAQLTNLLPRMRIWALSLTKNTSVADDLVQDVATKALVKQTSFELGTNFNAWIHRIMVNHFISSVREQCKFVGIEEMPDDSTAAEQHAKIDLDRLSIEFDRLPDYQKEVVRQIVIEQRTYEDVSKSSGCAIGTLKSRLHRARFVLRTRLDGEERLAA